MKLDTPVSETALFRERLALAATRPPEVTENLGMDWRLPMSFFAARAGCSASRVAIAMRRMVLRGLRLRWFFLRESQAGLPKVSMLIVFFLASSRYTEITHK